MKKETIILQQERDFGDKINATFSFVSQNFKTLFLSLLYFAGPLGLIGGIANGIVQSSMLGLASQSTKKNYGTSPSEIFADSFGKNFSYIYSFNYLISITFLILASITVAITTYAFIIEYRDGENKESITIERVWAKAVQKGLVAAEVSGLCRGPELSSRPTRARPSRRPDSRR